ncbi:tetratricopeptide repeat protein [Thalassotalea sp. PP2-459]|uniref:tetratricopeptide repeat protein n=1 Tax=Thalassotalea sp. PP2-459 TaxID=1742724 RepID=UPI001115172E|nr:tetratricopeptide repeat protein [Thalassotalea sp. PP2-459]
MMDYRESTLCLGTTDKLHCSNCGGQTHSVNSIITYGYYFLEYLPIVPIKRNTQVHCLQCQSIVDIPRNSTDLSLIFSNFALALFNKLRLLSTFSGSFLIVLFLSFYFSDEQLHVRQSQTHIDVPKVNDFYYLDYQNSVGDFRPHQKYRVAKIVDITGGTVSLVYGNYYYPLKSTLSNGVNLGHTVSDDYFEKEWHHFSYSQLNQLFQQGFIYRVIRPELNYIGRNRSAYMIDGNVVTEPEIVEKEWRYVPGKRQNTQAMAFLKSTHIEDRFDKAFELLKQSADLGYAPGQTHLAELYLTGIEGHKDVETAVYWLFEAAKQGYQPAVEKYRVICQLEEQCQIEDFYQALKETGASFTIY